MSTERTRFSRDSAMTMPPSTGVAPPDRPVPCPRGTNGTSCLRAQTHDLLHLRRRRRQDHGGGRGAQVRQRIALVGQHLERFAEHPVVSGNPPQRRQEGVVHGSGTIHGKT